MPDTNAKFDVIGIGNAIVDVLVHADDGLLEAEGLTKGAMALISAEEARSLYEKVGPAVECSGGSAANTIAGLASLGLPALCGFIGEFYVVLGTFSAQDKFPWAVPMAILAALGAILTAGYILWMIQRVYLGPAKEEYKNFPQATRTELGILVPLGVLCIALGVLPKHTVFNFMNGTLNMLVDHVAAAGALAQQMAAGGGL